MNTVIHQCVIQKTTPGGQTSYLAFCGYESEDIKEYRKLDKPIETITCEECYKRLTEGKRRS